MKPGAGKLVRSALIATVLGTVAFLLSGSELSGVLAAAIFYNEYLVRSDTRRRHR